MVTDLCWVCGEALLLSGLSRAAVHVFLVQRYNIYFARCTKLHDIARYCTILQCIAVLSHSRCKDTTVFLRDVRYRTIRHDTARYGTITRDNTAKIGSTDKPCGSV